MAENVGNIGRELGLADKKKFREKVYEQQWVIPNWDIIQRNEDAIKSHIFEFTTGMPTGAHMKWKMGFTFVHPHYEFHAYWNLVEANGFKDSAIQVTLNCALLNGDSTVYRTHIDDKLVSVGDVLENPGFLAFNSDNWRHWINPNGELVFKIKLAITEPDVHPSEFKVELFHKAEIEQMCNNLASLLDDKDTADLRIMTSDGNELLAHKIILKARCPVFESMFRTDFSENQTGIVIVKDVAAKTMKILLHLFYAGELLPSWKDPDTVVEFTYAAGKYQLTNVLKLLDELLGSRDEEDATSIDVQLLDLAQKLDLKTAEKELVERIKRQMSKVTSGAEFFALYGIGKE